MIDRVPNSEPNSIPISSDQTDFGRSTSKNHASTNNRNHHSNNGTSGLNNNHNHNNQNSGPVSISINNNNSSLGHNNNSSLNNNIGKDLSTYKKKKSRFKLMSIHHAIYFLCDYSTLTIDIEIIKRC